MQIFQVLTHFNTQYQKIIFVDTVADLIRKVFKYWEAVKYTMMDKSFLKFNFCLKVQILPLNQKLSVIFLEVTGLPWFIFKKMFDKSL